MDQPASSVYWAKVVKLPSEFLPWAVFTWIFGWIPSFWDDDLPDPRFRVLVGHHGAEEAVGVAVARRRRKANRQLIEISKLLESLSVREFEERYDLGGGNNDNR